MLFFIVTPQFRHHFRPPRQNDAMPMQPLVEVLLYWVCTTLGGLFGSLPFVALAASAFGDVQFDREDIAAICVLTALAPALFWIAYRYWRRLNH